MTKMKFYEYLDHEEGKLARPTSRAEEEQQSEPLMQNIARPASRTGEELRNN